MPSTATVRALHATASPAASNTASPQAALSFDHVWLFVEFTKGSLTSLDIELEFGHWVTGTGLVWDKVYDSQGTQVKLNFTANFDGWIVLSSQHDNTRMAPVPLGGEVWRTVVTPNGTASGSSIAVKAQPFSLGAIRE